MRNFGRHIQLSNRFDLTPRHTRKQTGSFPQRRKDAKSEEHWFIHEWSQAWLLPLRLCGNYFTHRRARSVVARDPFPLVVTLRSEEHTSELQSLAYLVC